MGMRCQVSHQLFRSREHDDWRLPNAHELNSILDYGFYTVESDGIRDTVSIDVDYFTEMEEIKYEGAGMFYWSSSALNYPRDEQDAFTSDPWTGVSLWWKTDIKAFVRCVRGRELDVKGAFAVKTVNGEKVVVDYRTHFTWQPAAEERATWLEALSYCENSKYAGFDDWRLPNVKELSTLINYDKTYPATDFPEELLRIDDESYDITDPEIAETVSSILSEAKTFIQSYLSEDPEGKTETLIIPPDILCDDDIVSLLIKASEKEKTLEQAWACAVLRVAHTITHVENDLAKSFMPGIRNQIYKRFSSHLNGSAAGGYFLGTGDDAIRVCCRHSRCRRGRFRRSDGVFPLFQKNRSQSWRKSESLLQNSLKRRDRTRKDPRKRFDRSYCSRRCRPFQTLGCVEVTLSGTRFFQEVSFSRASQA